ncbi:MAG: hypothetical protein J7K54_01585 [Candidatus Aenigmarchaeota archaeon]|nr:hypothetical protein [Candidatus Aenigmarchaeota archaeon]
MTDYFLVEKYRGMSPVEIREHITNLNGFLNDDHVSRKLRTEDIHEIKQEINYASRVLAQLRKADDGHPCDS